MLALAANSKTQEVLISKVMKVQKELIHAPFEIKLANFWIIKSK